MKKNDIVSRGLKGIVQEIIDGEGVVEKSIGGSVLVRLNDELVKYFFIGKSPTRYTGEYYFVVILVYESPRILPGDIGKAEILIRRGILGLGRRIEVKGGKILYDTVKKLADKKMLDYLYDSGYEYIVLTRGYKSSILKVSENSIVFVGRSTLIYTFNPKKLIGKLYRYGRRLLVETVREVYRGLNP